MRWGGRGGILSELSITLIKMAIFVKNGPKKKAQSLFPENYLTPIFTCPMVSGNLQRIFQRLTIFFPKFIRIRKGLFFMEACYHKITDNNM